MPDKKNVLIVGLEPTLIDFSQPGYPPGMTAAKVMAGLNASKEELTQLGFAVDLCLTDFGETAEAVLTSQLEKIPYTCIMVGNGVRSHPNHFFLFEKIINIIHAHAPQSKICFNTLPTDTTAAIKRWT